MAEIAPPPPPPPGSPPPPPPPRAPVLTAPPNVPVPPTVQALSAGARIELPLSAPLTGNTIQVQTPSGNLTLQLPQTFLNQVLQGSIPNATGGTLLSPANFTPGTPILLQVLGTSAPPQFSLLSVGGQSLGTGTAASASSTPAGAGPTSALSSRSPQLAPQGIVTATLLRPLQAPSSLLTAGSNPTSQASPTPTAPLPPTGAPTGSSPLNPQTISGPATLPGTTPAVAPAASAATPVAAGTAPTGAVTTLPSGTQLLFQVLQISAPPADGAASISATAQSGGRPPQLVPNTTLSGVITGQTTAAGQALVDTPLGPIALHAQGASAGSRVLLQLTGAPRLPAEPGNTLFDSFHTRHPLLASREWPSLREAAATLEDAAPNTAQQLSNTLIPRAAPNLAANMMFFLSALRGGDLRSWMGDGPSRVLSSTRPQLMTRLQDDFDQFTRIANDRDSGDWRLHVLPFQDADGLDQLRVLIRRETEGDGANEGKETGTRFVIDITLSQLGRVQLDGLVVSPEKRLDILVRTDDHLPSTMRTDIRGLFHSATDLTGFAGILGFKAKPAEFIEVAQPTTAESGIGVTV